MAKEEKKSNYISDHSNMTGSITYISISMSISSMGSGGSPSGGSVDQGGSMINPPGDVIGKNRLVAVE